MPEALQEPTRRHDRGFGFRLRRRVGRLAALTMVAGGLWVSVGATQSPAVAPPAWQVSTTQGPAVSDVLAVSCPSATVCYAVGTGYGDGGNAMGVVLTSTDGGSNWANVILPAGTADLVGVSCLSASTCVAVTSSAALVTTDSGATWASHSLGTGVSGIKGVSCVPGTTDCIAVGAGRAFRSTDSGTTWNPGTLPGSTAGLQAVACPTTGFCIAVGGSLVASTKVPTAVSSTDLGMTWSAVTTLPASIGYLSAIDCPSATTCVGVGGSTGTDVISTSTTNGGTTWSGPFDFTTHGFADPVGSGPLSGVACSSTSNCVAAGQFADGTGAVFNTTDGGTTWAEAALLADGASTGASCFGAHCVTVGIDIAVSTDSGATWPALDQTSIFSLPGNGPLAAIACPSATECHALGGSAVGQFAYGVNINTSDGGATWPDGSVPGDAGNLLGVSCPAPSHCVGVGNGGNTDSDGVVITTADAGANWIESSVPSSTTSNILNAVACASTTVCTAVGNNVIIGSTDGGATWTNENPPSQSTVYTLNAVACPTTTRCIAVGQSGPGATAFVTNDAGAHWSAQSVASAPNDLRGISCWSANNCVAVGEDNAQDAAAVVTTSDGGLTWAPQTVPGGVGFLLGVTCPSSSFCVSVGQVNSGLTDQGTGGNGVALISTDGGSTWAPQTLPTRTGALSAVACSSTGACDAAGQNDSGGALVLSYSRATTTTGASVAPSTAAPGSGALFSATVSPTGATGKVTFSTGSTTLCSGSVSAGAASCTASVALAGTYPVTASYSGDSNFQGSSAMTTFTVAAVAPPAPSGATGSNGASNTANGGTATATVGNITAVGAGPGALTVATYGGNPTGASVSGGTGAYYDVHLAHGSNFSSLTITVCNATPGHSLQWFNGTGWVEFSNQSTANGCLVATVNTSTSPTLAQLTGTPIAVSTQNAPGTAQSYTMVASNGAVYTFNAPYKGSLPDLGIKVNNIVGMVPTADAQGYWLVGSDGGIFAFGDAFFVGSLPGLNVHVNNVVGIVPTSSGHGYWMVGSDGGVFAFGDATFVGSLPGINVHVHNIVGIVPTPDNHGYWMVGNDGGVFAFNAPFVGSLPGLNVHVNNIVGIVPTAAGTGYWMVGNDGGVFAFNAPFVGSLPGVNVHVHNVVGIAPTPDNLGYWMVGTDGGLFSFGDATYQGSLPGKGIVVNNIVSVVAN